MKGPSDLRGWFRKRQSDVDGWIQRADMRAKRLAVIGGFIILVGAIGGLLVAISLVGRDESSPAPHEARPEEEAEEQDLAAPGEPYRLSIEATASGEGSVDVVGVTNLPDGALIHAFASRSFRNEGEPDIRGVNLAGEDVLVLGGEFSTTLALDESLLLVLVPPDVIETVSERVTVCAEFRTGEDLDGQQRQPDQSVVEAVGPFGERLASSPNVKVFGSATENPSNWLEVQTSVRLESPLLGEIAALQGRPPGSAPLEDFCLA